jgi:cyclic pyranopterin phosphate synthase
MNQPISQIQPEGAVRDRLSRSLRDLRISVIDRCNYRCPYCMPAEIYGEGHRFLPRSDWLTAGEIKRLAGLFVQLGVSKLRLTGGEPLLRRDIVDIVGSLAELSGVQDLALTTNATRLAEHAMDLKKAGLGRITISLDSLDDEVFRVMNGNRGDVATVLRGVDAARDAGFDTIKINCTVQRGRNDHTVLDLVEHFRGTGIIVRFIEFMDVGSLNGWRAEDVVPSKELLARVAERWPVEPLSQNYRGEVAERYRFVDGMGELGFISSVSSPFCGDCHRARISADGTAYTCLFANAGTNLRVPLRAGSSDADIIGLLQNVWRRRADRYSEIRGKIEVPDARVEMYRMGG